MKSYILCHPFYLSNFKAIAHFVILLFSEIIYLDLHLKKRVEETIKQTGTVNKAQPLHTIFLVNKTLIRRRIKKGLHPNNNIKYPSLPKTIPSVSNSSMSIKQNKEPPQQNSQLPKQANATRFYHPNKYLRDYFMVRR